MMSTAGLRQDVTSVLVMWSAAGFTILSAGNKVHTMSKDDLGR
jgi:hypothetical protein